MPKIIKGIDWAEVEQQYHVLGSVNAVAKAHGVSNTCIRNQLQKRGVDVSQKPLPRQEKACAECDRTMSVTIRPKSLVCRTCRMRHKRWEDIEATREARRRYYRENKDKHQIWCARWREKNREHLRRYHREVAYRYTDTRKKYITARRAKQSSEQVGVV